MARAILALVLGMPVGAWAQDEPAFIAPVLQSLGLHGPPVARETRQGITRTRHATADGTFSVTIDRTACEPARCGETMRLALDYLNRMATGRSGRLLEVSDTDLRAEWRDGLSLVVSLVQRFPGAILVWTAADARASPAGLGPVLAAIRKGANLQRATELSRAADALLVPWVGALHEHAMTLRADGEAEPALLLLRRLAAAAPGRPDILADLAEAETQTEAARGAARVVMEQAEDPAQRQRAAAVLGISLPTLAALPAIAPTGDGLRLILVALPPCDVGLLTDAARRYEQITNVPTIIVRLDGDWNWGAEQRFLGQLMVLEELRRQRGGKLDGDRLDTEGWDRERILAALRSPPAGADAFTRYSREQSARAVASAPAQYEAGGALDRMSARIAAARTVDSRAMYVGVTEAALHTAETHFVFSQSRAGEAAIGIVSNTMMLTRAVAGGGAPSRARLVERLAKELVAASLAQLAIPRPSDPTNLYAPTESVAQLDAKAAALSDATRAALEVVRAGR